eukprot:UN04167
MTYLGLVNHICDY